MPACACMEGATRRIGLFRREPSARLRGRRSPAPAPPTRRRVDPRRLVQALDRLVVLAPLVELAARGRAADDHADRARGRSSGRPFATRPTVVLQDLLRGVRDRVVVAVTFLALLELMKRREIVVDAGRAVGADRRPRDDRRRSGRRPALTEDATDAPIDESLESFA